MSNFKKMLTRIVVMFIFLVNTETSVVNSALGEITKAFPQANATLVSLISTTPILIMFIMSFFVGKIADKLDKKSMVLTALVLYTIGGVGGFFVSSNIYMIIVSRAILGLGAGMAAPLCGSVIAELYTGDDRAHMYGLTNGVDSLIATFVTMLGGVLMMIKWNYIFLAYSIFFIVIALVVYALPSMPHTTSITEEKKVKITYNKDQKIKLAVMAAFVFLNLLGGMLLMLKLAIYVTQYNLGTPLFISTAFSIFSIVIMCFSMVFGFVNKFMKRYTLILAPLASIVAYIILLTTKNPACVIAAMIIAGLGSAILMPSMQTEAATIGKKEHSAYAMSVVFGALFLGQFCATFVQAFLGLFGDPSIEAVFVFGIVLLTIIAVSYAVFVKITSQQTLHDTESIAK